MITLTGLECESGAWKERHGMLFPFMMTGGLNSKRSIFINQRGQFQASERKGRKCIISNARNKMLKEMHDKKDSFFRSDWWECYLDICAYIQTMEIETTGAVERISPQSLAIHWWSLYIPFRCGSPIFVGCATNVGQFSSERKRVMDTGRRWVVSIPIEQEKQVFWRVWSVEVRFWCQKSWSGM